MNKPFKILFGIFIFLLILGAFFVFSPFTEKYVSVGYSAFTIDFIIGLVLFSSKQNGWQDFLKELLE